MASSSSSTPTTNKGFDHLYNVDKEALESLKAQKPWNEGDGARRPRYFKNCYVSAGAAVKMLEHSLRGVEKGMSSANRMPVEVSTTTSFLLRCDCHSFSLPTSWLTSLLCSFFFSSFFLYFFSFIFLLCSSTFFSPSSPHPLPPLLLHRSWACSLVVLPLIPTIHTPSL